MCMRFSNRWWEATLTTGNQLLLKPLIQYIRVHVLIFLKLLQVYLTNLTCWYCRTLKLSPSLPPPPLEINIYFFWSEHPNSSFAARSRSSATWPTHPELSNTWDFVNTRSRKKLVELPNLRYVALEYNIWWQLVGNVKRICMGGEQGLLSSNFFSYKSS